MNEQSGNEYEDKRQLKQIWLCATVRLSPVTNQLKQHNHIEIG